MTQKAFSQGSPFPATTPDVLRIYSMRFCPYAQRTRLVLAHKNIQHETVNINLKNKPDWFLSTNPLGQVPVLQLGDQVIAESTATCDWLDDVYPETRLTPTDPYRRALDRVLYEYSSKIMPPMIKLMRAEPADVQQEMEEVNKHLAFYDGKLQARGAGPYFGGDQPAMIDLLLWPFFERLFSVATIKDNPAAAVDPNKFPTLTSWYKAMLELPAVKATAFGPAQHAEYFKGYLTGTPNYDMYLEE